MVIRSEQMDTFAGHMRRKVERRSTGYLRAKFPEETASLDEQALENLVVLGFDKAERYGIESEEDIDRYLDYMIVLSSDFDTDDRTSWAGPILRRTDRDGAWKMEQIDNVYLYSRR